MSADNGYILRKNKANKFVLQVYCASAETYPDVEKAGPNCLFDTLEAAIDAYESDIDEYYTEYGLTIKLKE